MGSVNAMVTQNLVFKVQTGFSFSLLVFCMSMLAAGQDASVYLPILTSLIGYWLPAPQYHEPLPSQYEPLLAGRHDTERDIEAQTQIPTPTHIVSTPSSAS